MAAADLEITLGHACSERSEQDSQYHIPDSKEAIRNRQIANGHAHPNEVDTPSAPTWLRNPATIQPITSLSDFTDRANRYFEDCLDAETRPTITGLALATGLPGPTSLIRLGQRIPDLRHVISRCMTAVAHQYEQLVGMGGASSGAQFMLKNIPDFDPEDPEGAPGVQFFNDRKEVLLQAEVYGAATSGEEYDSDVDPVEVYMSVIKKPGGIGHTSSVQSKLPRGDMPHHQRLFAIIEESIKEPEPIEPIETESLGAEYE